MCLIQIECCRAWSKYTQGTSRYNKLHAQDEAAAEKKLGVRELKKLKKKEREGQHPEEGTSHHPGRMCCTAMLPSRTPELRCLCLVCSLV